MTSLKEKIKIDQNKVKIFIGSTVITLVIGSLIWAGTRKNAYSVKVNDKVVAVVKTQEEVSNAYEQVVAQLKQELGVDIAVKEQLELEPVHSKKSELKDSQALMSAIEEAISYNVEAYEILVDGEGYAIVANQEDAKSVLEQVAKSCIPKVGELTLSQEQVSKEEQNGQKENEEQIQLEDLEDQASDTQIVEIEEALPQDEVSAVVHVESFNVKQEAPSKQEGQKIKRSVESLDFNEEVVIRNVYVEEDSILTVDAAKEKLLTPETEGMEYTLVEGDNVWDIAMQYGTTVERIMELNPDIQDETTMQIGQVIKLESPTPILSITTVEEATYKQLVPAEIQYVVFSHLYEGQTQVYQEGRDGLNEITVAVTKVNGQEVSRESISEKVLLEPVIKVIGYGVKKKPTVDNSVVSSGKGSFIHPLNGAGRVSSTYGSRWGRFHKGIDFAASAGTPIYASAGGKVIYSGYNSGGYGKLIIIEHSNGYQTYYAHCSKLYANVGDSIAKGQRIAGVGSTGDSTGNHLHFEIRKNGTPVNPSKYL
ncbi:MAG: M23 family metallopeptidase [Cellulosilyticum sp.]|nr:M23 family metallopeptidase [Cellulosilyticum sp.]